MSVIKSADHIIDKWTNKFIYLFKKGKNKIISCRCCIVIFTGRNGDAESKYRAISDIKNNLYTGIDSVLVYQNNKLIT